MAAQLHLGLHIAHLPVRKIDIDAPSRWMVAAWRDLARAPAVALGYGALFVVVGYLVVLGLHQMGLGSLVPAAIASFFLIAPILVVGLYEVSRQAENGQTITLEQSLRAFRRNLPGLSGMGLILMLCVAVWMQLAILVFTLFYHASPPGLDNFIYGVLTADQAVPFLIVGTVVGGAIAAFVFAITAVSIPLLLDRDVPVLSAMATSVTAVVANWKIMLGWAATIVVLVGVGLTTFFLGLILAVPLVAFGTWHAYRDLVE